jgi:hypothetical protein
MARIPDLPDIYQGNDVTWDLTFKDSAGSPIDITGSTIYFIVKTNQSDTDANAIMAKTITVHTAPASGESQLVLTDTDTNVDAGHYYGEFQFDASDTKITTIASTQINILEKIKD